MIRIKDIAFEAGLSAATISRALNNSGYVSAANRDKITAACQKLNYPAPENLSAGRYDRSNRKLVGIIVPDITIPYYATVINQLERYLLERGCLLIVACTNENSEQELKILNEFYEQHLSGVIIVPSSGFMKYNYERLIDLKKSGTAIVLFDRGLYNEEFQSFDGVFIDDFSSTYIATKHLIKHGHRYISLVVGSSGLTNNTERFKGYISALEENNLPFCEDYIVYGGTIGSSYVSTTLTNTTKLLESHTEITAVVSTNNMMTVGVMQAMEGKKNPSDISIVSFDFDYLDQFYPNLITTVYRSIEDISQELIRLLFNRIESATTIGRKSTPLRQIICPVLKPKASVHLVE